MDADVGCPFYCSEGMSKIYCVGTKEKEWLHIAWESDTERKRHKREYCKGNWRSCPVAKLARKPPR